MRFHNLQILRLVAALGVVGFHLGIDTTMSLGKTGGVVPWLKMSRVAPFFVPLFFALSGFVLTHSLHRGSPGRWAVLRAVRLYPAYWLAAGAVGVAAWSGLWPGPDRLPWLPDPSAASIFLLPTSVVRPGQFLLVVEWSLIYEMVLSASLLTLWVVVGRRLPVAVTVWLAVLAVKAVAWPGYGTRPYPTWNSVLVSGHMAPFLLGVVAYYLRDRGRRWRWAVLAGAVGLNYAAGWELADAGFDVHLWVRGAAAALTVWFAANVRDAAAGNPLVVAGGWSYGLYLAHNPLILFAYSVMKETGVLAGKPVGIVLVGLGAVVVGLWFGRFEQALYGRLKRLVDAAGPRWERVADRYWKRLPPLAGAVRSPQCRNTNSRELSSAHTAPSHPALRSAAFVTWASTAADSSADGRRERAAR